LGIISPLGRLRGPEQLGTEVPHAIKKRLKKNKNDQYSFEVADSVSLTQKDIRELQLAVGAIRAGVNIILKKAALKTSQLSRVLIAGGFGSFVRRRNAQRIGLLPSDIDHEKISYVGNVALAGAKMSVLSRKARKRAEMIAENVEHLELSLDLDFQNEFADAMMFPEK